MKAIKKKGYRKFIKRTSEKPGSSLNQPYKTGLTKRAPDSWDSARLLELVLSFAIFQFRKLALPSRR